jgi:hypothetical protein
MNIQKEASKLFTNKYFLYFILFLAVVNLLGYLVTNKINAIIFFILIGVLTFQFSKNMAIVLLVALIGTNFLISSKIIREGLENAGDDTSSALQNASAADPQIAGAVPIVQSSTTTDEALAKQKKAMTNPTGASAMATTNQSNSTMEMPDTTTTDVNNPDLNMNYSSAATDAPEGFGDKMGNNKKGGSNNGSRIDYAATLEDSYKHLDSILGSDSLKQLTSDTQSLMTKQQELFNTMENMVPMLEGAQNMLSKFDMSNISESIKKLVPMAQKKKQ